MAKSSGLNEISYLDCPGGGQVFVDNGVAYVGHTVGPQATTIIDVSDPKSPRQIAQLCCKHAGVHAHKVQVKDGIMITNYESIDYAGHPDSDFRGGLNIFDVSKPHSPKHITFWPCDGTGVHRFTFDGEYAYISPEVAGYDGNICMILDVRDSSAPEEVGRWHMPGQWSAGGESRSWKPRAHRCHHPIRLGDRLYVSYWHGGWVILNIEDLSTPRLVSGMDWSPPFPWPTHTCLPIPFEIKGRKLMLVADEDVAKLHEAGPSFVWLVDITDEARPVPFASFQVEGIDDGVTPPKTGCHQPAEQVTGTEIPVAWFAQGLRVIDIANPHAIKEAAYFVPDAPPGSDRAQSNDVYVDGRGLIYLIDRVRGLSILERS